MGIVEKHLQNLVWMEENIEDFASDIVQRNAEKIILILQEKQLGIGLYSDGSPLGFYSPYTQEIATEEGISHPKNEGDPYNFQWTGTTFSTMLLNADVGGDKYSIFSRTGKEQALREAYGDELFKLSEANNTLVNETIIEPELIIFIEENWWRTTT